jgi:hypothetical protein
MIQKVVSTRHPYDMKQPGMFSTDEELGLKRNGSLWGYLYKSIKLPPEFKNMVRSIENA